MKFFRISLLALLSFGILIIAFATLQRNVLLLAAPLLLYLIMGLLLDPDPLDLVVSHSPRHSRVHEGTHVRVDVLITNRGSQINELMLEDLIPASLQILEGSNCVTALLRKNETLQLDYTVVCARGVHQFHGLSARASNPFGMGARGQVYQANSWIRAIPDVRPLRRIQIHPRRTRVYSGTIPTRLGGVGVEFFGVRPFEYGDPLRWINWRATAKRQSQIILNEFLQERVADIGIIVDGRRRTNFLSPNHSSFNDSVRAAATLADAFVNTGNRVGLLVFGRHLDWTQPDYGKVQLERLLRALAKAEEGDSQVFDQLQNLPTHIFPTNSQLVLISPLALDDVDTLLQLRKKGFELLIVAVNPLHRLQRMYEASPTLDLSFRLAELERQLITRQALQAGIQMVHWDIEKNLEGALNAQMSRPHHWYQRIRR